MRHRQKHDYLRSLVPLQDLNLRHAAIERPQVEAAAALQSMQSSTASRRPPYVSPKLPLTELIRLAVAVLVLNCGHYFPYDFNPLRSS